MPASALETGNNEVFSLWDSYILGWLWDTIQASRMKGNLLVLLSCLSLFPPQRWSEWLMFVAVRWEVWDKCQGHHWRHPWHCGTIEQSFKLIFMVGGNPSLLFKSNIKKFTELYFMSFLLRLLMISTGVPLRYPPGLRHLFHPAAGSIDC